MIEEGLIDDSFSINTTEHETSNVKEKYAEANTLYEAFFKIANLGDVGAIYRNRPCFLNQKRSALVSPATEVFLDLPSSRCAVYHYTGLLIHESVNYWFNKKENVQQVLSVTSVRESAMRLLDFYIKFFTDLTGKSGLEEVLAWMCELSAELSAKNTGRPATAHSHSFEELLTTFKSNEVVEKLLELMNLVVSRLLEDNQDVCMKILFEASRHGPQFSWMWLHIATLLQGGIITHLLKSGAEQFKSYVSEFQLRKNDSTASPAVLNIIQTEYEHKFQAISYVFNVLMNKRNPELQEAVSQLIVESLDINKEKDNKFGFAFFIKLVTCNSKTLQILVECNSHLITPFNTIRAIRQVQSIDTAIILPSTNFIEFVDRILREVDPLTYGVVFETMIELVYNHEVFVGENLPEMAESNMRIGNDCFPILEMMITRIVRIAHATGPLNCPSLHPAISRYASGRQLQFIINTICRHLNRSASVVRHLHAMSIANGEMKAAEIVMRFLMTISYTEQDYMYVLISYVQTMTPYFPSMMSTMYEEFASLKTLIELSFPEDTDFRKLHMNLLHNLRTLIHWEHNGHFDKDQLPDDRNQIQYLRLLKLYPAEHMGAVLNVVLVDTLKLVKEFQEESDNEGVSTVIRLFSRIIESICASTQGDKDTDIKFMISLSNWYKLMAQLAILLKNALFLVGKEFNEGLSVFEELRTTILIFLYNNHVHESLEPYVSIFIQLFSTACIADTKTLFNEEIDYSMQKLIDETGQNKTLELTQVEDGPSVIDGLRKMKMRDTALDMLHKGQLKRRRGNGVAKRDEQFSEDAKQRIFVLLDALHSMCFTGSMAVRLTNSKQLAYVLVNAVCKEAVNSDMRFDDWDIEWEFIHRHVEIERTVSQSALCNGLLRILSESRSFAFCMPIMKSKLAVIINDTMRFLENRSCSELLRAKLHQWIMLAHQGGLLPFRLIHVADLEKFSTVLETHQMLLEVWKYFTIRNLTPATIEKYHSDLLEGNVDEGLPNEAETMEKMNFSTMRVIIQNHITDAYTLFPSFFPAEYDFLKLSKLE